MSYWESYNIEEKIINILKESKSKNDNEYTYLFPYQIAIKLDNINPDIATSMNIPIGGINCGNHNSLSQYIAKELSTRIKSSEITNIECAFMNCDNLKQLIFCEDHHANKIFGVTNNNEISMFRYKVI